MADNTELNAGTGGDVIATDDIGGVKYPRSKISLGADGAASDAIGIAAALDSSGTGIQAVGVVGQFDDASVAAVTENQFAPVRISSRRALLVEGVASGTAIPVSDGGGALTVDGTVAVSGTVTVDGSGATQPVSHAALTELAAAIDTEVQVDIVAPLPAGTNAIGKLAANSGVDIGDVDVTSLTPGTAAGNLGKAEDAAHSTGDTGVAALAVRRDTPAVGSGDDGDYSTVNVDAIGRVWTHDPVAEALLTTIDADTGAAATSLAVLDDWDESDRAKVNVIAGQAGITAGAGAVAASTPRVTLASDDPAVALLGTIDADTSALAGAVAGAEVQVDVVAALPAGTNNIGDVDVLSIVPGTGATNLGKAEDAAHASGDVGVMAMSVRQNTAAALGGTDADYQPLITDANGRLHTIEPSQAAILTAVQLIDNPVVAHDAAVSGATGAAMAGFNARSADPTAVASADATYGLASLLGKLVTLPFAIPAASWSYANPTSGVTDTSDDVAKAAGGAGVRNYITSVQVINAHATVSTEVVIKDGSTVLWRGWAQAIGGGVSAQFNPPLRGTADTAVNVANITTGAQTYFNLQGYTAAE